MVTKSFVVKYVDFESYFVVCKLHYILSCMSPYTQFVESYQLRYSLMFCRRDNKWMYLV